LKRKGEKETKGVVAKGLRRSPRQELGKTAAPRGGGKRAGIIPGDKVTPEQKGLLLSTKRDHDI